MSGWILPARMDGERFDLSATAAGYAILRKPNGETIGTISLTSQEHTLVVDSLCIDPPHRSYGAGSEAARLLTLACDSAGIRCVRAWAHPNLGLSAYFWTRMGFSPRHGEGPEGGIWFERVLR